MALLRAWTASRGWQPEAQIFQVASRLQRARGMPRRAKEHKAKAIASFEGPRKVHCPPVEARPAVPNVDTAAHADLALAAYEGHCNYCWSPLHTSRSTTTLSYMYSTSDFRKARLLFAMAVSQHSRHQMLYRT